MASKITVALEDDLEGGPADETVRFGVGGTQYEIDLNKKNARAFRKQPAPFVEHARRAGRGQTERPRCPAAPRTARLARHGTAAHRALRHASDGDLQQTGSHWAPGSDCFV